MKLILKKKIKNLLKNFKKIENKLINKILLKKNYKKLSKKYNKIKKLNNFYQEFKKYKKLKKESKSLIIFEDIKKLAQDDLSLANKNLNLIKIKIKKFFKKKNKKQNIFIEIKIGVGGNESAIFVGDLSRMYIKYSEKKNWKTKIISKNYNNFNGYKEIIILIKGLNVYDELKFESGVHRVQRMPVTENQNRIHTSTCKVAVSLKKKLSNIDINSKDLKIDTFKSSGAGGQHVNKTNSAVRVKHIKTGITVECQNDRSQHKNKKQALKLIKYKISMYNLKIENEKKNIIKKSLLGSGERSEKIRTYNYPKNRVTDHRINLTIYKLNSILDGNLEEIINKLKN